MTRPGTVKPGDRLALRHGSQSPALIAERMPAAVAEVRAALALDVPYLEDADTFLVELAARTVVRIRLIDRYLDGLGGSLLDGRGRPRGCAALLITLQRELRSTLAALGVGPVVRAGIASDLGHARRGIAAAEAARSLRDRYPASQPSQPVEVPPGASEPADEAW